MATEKCQGHIMTSPEVHRVHPGVIVNQRGQSCVRQWEIEVNWQTTLWPALLLAETDKYCSQEMKSPTVKSLI